MKMNLPKTNCNLTTPKLITLNPFSNLPLEDIDTM